MKDERIQTALNRFAARGFCIWYVLMMIAVYYRMLILKQHPREWWDIFAIFCVGTLFVFISYANKGIFDLNFKRFWWSLSIYITILLFTLFFIKGEIHSVGDGGMYLGGILLGIGPVIAIAYFLNRRWKRKEGIEDEK